MTDSPEPDLVERVALAIAESDGLGITEWPGVYEERARAALAVLRGDTTTALGRVEALATSWTEWAGTDEDPRSQLTRLMVAELRAAIAGESK